MSPVKSRSDMYPNCLVLLPCKVRQNSQLDRRILQPSMPQAKQSKASPKSSGGFQLSKSNYLLARLRGKKHQLAAAKRTDDDECADLVFCQFSCDQTASLHGNYEKPPHVNSSACLLKTVPVASSELH